jgi:hypothetical protein
VSSWDAFSIGMSSDARIERSIIAVVAWNVTAAGAERCWPISTVICG